MQNLNYHIENEIVCVFDVTDYTPQTLTSLTDLAQKILGTPGFLFLTSGSTSRPKFVLHSKASLECSAYACQQWLNLSHQDRWMNVLSPHHMGGFSTYFRTQTLGLLPVYSTNWDLAQLPSIFEKHSCTLLSLVPAQVFEIVQKQVAAPQGLRAVIVGGGGMDLAVHNEALKLGWPLLSSLGSTETGSQIFTQKADDLSGGLWALPHFEVRTDLTQLLQIKGDGLFTAYLFKNARGTFEAELIQKDLDGFWTSSDRVQLKGRRLMKFLGRQSDQVKVSGHLVDLCDVRQRFKLLAEKHQLNQKNFYIDVLVDAKSEHHLVLFKDQFSKAINEAVREWNMQMSAHERLKAQYYIKEIPRSELGKVLSSKLKSKFTEEVKLNS